MNAKETVKVDTAYVVRKGDMTDALQISLLYMHVWDEFQGVFPKL